VCCDSITINPDTGTVRLRRALDFAEVQRLDYVVQATDGIGASSTAELTITVVDHEAEEPRFSAPQYTAHVPELSTNLIPEITVYVSSLLHRVWKKNIPSIIDCLSKKG